MCQVCIDSLQKTMDDAVLKSPPERLLVHLDDFLDDSTPHGEVLDKQQVELGLHDSNNEQCWCRPIVIQPGDTRTAIEVVADYTVHDVGEVLV